MKKLSLLLVVVSLLFLSCGKITTSQPLRISLDGRDPVDKCIYQIADLQFKAASNYRTCAVLYLGLRSTSLQDGSREDAYADHAACLAKQRILAGRLDNMRRHCKPIFDDTPGVKGITS